MHVRIAAGWALVVVLFVFTVPTSLVTGAIVPQSSAAATGDGMPPSDTARGTLVSATYYERDGKRVSISGTFDYAKGPAMTGTPFRKVVLLSAGDTIYVQQERSDGEIGIRIRRADNTWKASYKVWLIPPKRTTTSAPSGTTPSPTTPTAPTGASGTASTSTTPLRSTLELAADAVDDHIDSLRSACFGSVVSLGDKAKYRAAINPRELVIEDGTPLAISTLGNRGAGGALADRTDRWGAPLPNMMFLPFKIPTTSGAPALSRAKQSTIWHEGTHHIEGLHGDRQTPDFQKHIAYRERNAAYLDAAIIALQELALTEKHMRAKNEGESDEEWQEWKRLNGWPDLARIAARFPAIELGVATQEALKGKFKPGDREVWPPDLRQLQAWTGIRIRFSDILDRYASGACGEELKVFALKERAKRGR